MNNIYKIPTFLILGLCIIMSVSCSDDDKWNPGPQIAADNPGVYFDKDNPASFDIEVDDNNNLSKDHIIVSLRRDASKAGSSVQVPITVLSADNNLSIPQSVQFDAGSDTAELKIAITRYEGKPLNFSLGIDDKYSTPYADGYYRYDGMIKVLVLFSVTFTPGEYSGSTKPQFVPFRQTVIDNQDGTYTIPNFLFNNDGYDFTFSLEEEKTIRPVFGCGWHDDESARWYFYSGDGDVSANRIPCYIPGANPDDYITYVYFYTAENSTSYQAFNLDLKNKTGKMMGYARYSKSSSGRIAFNISW